MATSSINPEVIRMPHIETPHKWGGKPLLYKGLNPEQFGRYFRAQGISPLYPERPWVTNHMGTALEYGGLSPINNPGISRGEPVEDICVAVIDPRVMERGHLRAVRTLDVPLLSFGLRHYQGKEHFTWQDVMELIVTPKTLEIILSAYNLVRPKDLPAMDLADKLKVVDPAPAPVVKKKVDKVVHDIAELDPKRSYNPW